MGVLYNTKIRIYPDGRRITTYCSEKIFDPDKVEDSSLDIASSECNDISFIEEHLIDNIPDEAKRLINERRASIRARQRIFDIAYMNDFYYFVTFTFDPSINHNVSACMSYTENWLRNVRSRGLVPSDLKYLIVPEYGGLNHMIHLHCLFSKIDVVPSGTFLVEGFDKPVKLENIPKGSVIKAEVFNIPYWKSGFSTAIKIYRNDGALSSYFTKYMTKDQKIIFGKYYWSSQNLSREPKIEYTNTCFSLVNAPVYDLPMAGVKLKYSSSITY